MNTRDKYELLSLFCLLTLKTIHENKMKTGSDPMGLLRNGFV